MGCCQEADPEVVAVQAAWAGHNRTCSITVIREPQVVACLVANHIHTQVVALAVGLVVTMACLRNHTQVVASLADQVVPSLADQVVPLAYQVDPAFLVVHLLEVNHRLQK